MTSLYAMIVHGLPGAGKSTFAASVAAFDRAAVLLSNDVIRRQLGFPRLGPEYTARVYEFAADRAVAALAAGRPAILDATFYKRSYRRLVLAPLVRERAPIVLAEITTPLALCRARVASREGEVHGVDDIARFDDLLKNWEKWAEDEIELASARVTIDCSSLPPKLVSTLGTRCGRALEAILKICQGEES